MLEVLLTFSCGICNGFIRFHHGFLFILVLLTFNRNACKQAPCHSVDCMLQLPVVENQHWIIYSIVNTCGSVELLKMKFCFLYSYAV